MTQDQIKLLWVALFAVGMALGYSKHKKMAVIGLVLLAASFFVAILGMEG